MEHIPSFCVEGAFLDCQNADPECKIVTLNVLEERKFESFTRFSTLRFSLPDPDFWQSILECVFSLGFGRFVLEKWQLSHGFAVDVP